MNEVTKVENEVARCDDRPYDRILELAISQGAPLEQLEKWMNLKREYESDEARKEFYKAVAAFKRESIVITKDKVNTQFKSKYSSLGNLLETVNPFLGKHGLSVSFVPEQSEKMVSVTCQLRHELGYTESVTLSAPPDTSGGNSKNQIQQIKSTFTYLRSATFEAVTGLSGTDASISDDGNLSGKMPEYISTDQATEINDFLIYSYKDKGASFLSLLKCESVETIPASKYKAAIAMIDKVKNASRNKKY